jgi:hypothetical protein
MYRYLKQNKIGHEGYFPKPKDKFNLYTHTKITFDNTQAKYTLTFVLLSIHLILVKLS